MTLSSASLSPEIQQAMKDKDVLRLSVLRLLSSSLKAAEVQKMGDLTDDEAIAVVAKEVRKCEEAAAEFERGGRDDRRDAELKEAELLRQWLPEQLGSEELEILVEEAIAESGASGPQQMGAVMKALMPKVKGRADGKTISELVKTKLS